MIPQEVITQQETNNYFRHWYSWSPVTASNWANTKNSDLKSSSCWSLVTSCYKSGDVIAGAGHVGIVTGKGKRSDMPKLSGFP